MPIEKRDGRWFSYKNEIEKHKRFNDLVRDLKPHELEAFNELLKTNSNQIFENIDTVQWDPNTGPPVPIEDWLNSEYFLGQTAKDIYPVFKKDLAEIFNNNYSEIILCLHPDTRVPLLDGTTPTLKELSEKWNKDREPFWVYSMRDGEIIPAQAVAPRPTGVDDYYKVTLDNGSYFIANSKHEMMARDGSRLRVSDMKKGDSLMPFNTRKSEKSRDSIADYEMIQQPNTGRWEFTHRMVAHNHINTVREKSASIIHHVNFLKENNTPENLQFLTWKDHQDLHWTDVSKYNNNHYVVSVEKVGKGDVYCLTVPETSNFAIVTPGIPLYEENKLQVLRSGVFSRNSGSTRSGKSYSACAGILRVIYELYCLADPSRSNAQGAGEPVEIVMFSHTKEAAKKVLFAKLKNMLMQSPFFKERYEETKDEIRFPGKSIHVIGAASSDKDLLGTNVFAAIGDELNFLGSVKVNSEKSASGDGYDKAQQVYNSLARRIKGTFKGRGKLFLVSSKKNSNDFTERRIRESIEAKDDSVFVRDYATWDTKPFRFSKQKWYRIAYSDKGSSPLILKNDQEKAPDGWNVIKFPEEFLPEFEKDSVGCFTGDTQIQMYDGSYSNIQDLVGKNQFFVYSCDSNGNFTKGNGHSARLTKKNAEIIKITLDNGAVYNCTPNHLFMLESGEYKEARNLKSIDKLKVRRRLVTNQPTSIFKIESNGIADVYDITVDNYHNFALGDGVIVHNSLRDIGGVSIDSASAFLSDRLAIDRVFKDKPSLFDRDSWATGTRINVKWNDISTKDAKGNLIMTCCPNANRHVALDLSKNMCDTGFVIAHRAADGEVIRHSGTDGAKSLVEAPYIHVDAILQIVPPAGKGTEVDHRAVRELIAKLRDDGIPIKSVSLDQWSGPPNAQELIKAGFKVERDFSVVRKPDAYITLKSLIYEDRLECPIHEVLKKELYDLELTPDGKVEHSPSGKKDSADALAAAVYWLILNAKPSSGTSIIKGGHHNYYSSPINEVGYNMKGDYIFPDDDQTGGDAPLFIVL